MDDRLGLDVMWQRGVTMRTRDGTELVADLWHPEGQGPWPTLLVRTAYGREVASSVTSPHPATLARAGYLVVTQDVRGRGDSRGPFEPFHHEAADGYDTIAWAASLPESNGAVGTYGFSYQGCVQLAAAAERPPALRAIAPAMGSADPADGFLHEGGIFRLAFATSWASQLSGVDGFVGDALPAVLARRCAEGRVEAWPLWDDWAAGRCGPVADVAKIAVPALFTVGWFDSFSRAGVRDHAAVTSPTFFIGAPWWHMPWSEGAAIADEILMGFLDQHVAGRPPRSGATPPKATVLAIGGEANTFAAWPPPAVVTRRFGLRSRGRAATRFGDGILVEDPGVEGSGVDGPPDVAVYQPAVPVPAVGHAYAPFLGQVGLADQRAVQERTDVLCYTSEPFGEAAAVAGSARASLDLRSPAPTHDACLTLCAVTPDGPVLNLARGVARGPGRLEVTFSPVMARLEPGSRIRLAVAPSAYPELAPNRSSGWAPVTRALGHDSWVEVPLLQ